jgi:hypothetical protein
VVACQTLVRRRPWFAARVVAARFPARTIRAMSGDTETWYELWPGGVAPAGAERYGRKSEAEQAATAMLIRQPELPLVEIAECGMRGEEAVPPAVVGRISPSQPPAPDEAEIDDLHKLPRGAPEQ